MDTPTQLARSVTADALEDAVWHKSSYSGTSGNCVEVATNLPGLVVLRDSKDPEGPALVFAVSEWRGFVEGVRGGQLGL